MLVIATDWLIMLCWVFLHRLGRCLRWPTEC